MELEDADIDVVVSRVIRDVDQLVSHPRSSQYASGGVSACGLASLNFTRLVFEKEKSGLRDESLLRAVVSKANVMNIISICPQWPERLHVEVETILQAPIFEQSLKEVTCHYGTPSFDKFKELLRDLSNTSVAAKRSAGAVITRPPEIVACARTPQGVFIVFDSHSRPEHPKGSGLFLTKSLERAARYLHNLLYVDSSVLSDSGLQWQAQLLANFSAHIFVSNSSMQSDLPGLTQSLLECSLEVLTLRAQVSDLTTQNQLLTEQSDRLEEELETLQDDHKRLGKQLREKTIHGEHEDTGSVVHSNYKGKGRAEASTSAELAWKLQQAFDSERAQIESDKQLVRSSAQATFDCCVCLETHPIDFSIAIPGCSHTTCRNCLREHIVTMLRDHRYPLFCPGCVGDSRRAEITQDVIFDVGILEKEFAIFEEAQLSVISILLHCRGCQESVFVDRTEYQESKIVACPLPRCTHAWCKACQQTITPTLDGPPHSCDGSSELDHLMKQSGWKYCPGCKTPVMKESGCNHMTCMSPGCNTHFCYICGESIVRSALRNDIRSSVSAHYRKCRLFEVPA